MKIARIEAIRLFPSAINEAWTEDAYVWPSTIPCVLVMVSAEDGSYGLGEASSQVWYLGETAEQIESCIRLYHAAL